MYKPKPKFEDTAADELFQQFVHELETYSTNGVVKRFDLDRLWPVAQHYIEQCEEMDARVDLEERIRLLLASKYNYTLQESKLRVSEKLELSVREKIKALLQDKIKNAGKFAGLVLNWAIVKPIQIVRDLIQPVVANTVLTYAVAFHPPYMSTMEIEVTNSAAISSPSVSAVATDAVVRNYDELQAVKSYSSEDLNQISANARQPLAEEKRAVHQAISSVKKTIAAKTPIPKEVSATIDIERGRVVSGATVPTANVAKEQPSSRSSREIRPIGIIQQTLGIHENRILNCYQSYKKSFGKKNGRIAVKMIVTPKGVAKDVSIVANSFNKEFANRVMIQLKGVQFSEVDARLGDQVIYHTFYF